MKATYIYDTKEIMNRAWEIKRANKENTLITLSVSLKMAWAEAKKAMKEVEVAEAEVEEEPNVALSFNGSNLMINVNTGVISGETYPVAKYLKRKGCEYNAQYKVWTTDDAEYFVEKYAA